MATDWKYKILAVNPCSGNIHTEEDAALFLAKDKAFTLAMSSGKSYTQALEELGADEAQIQGARKMILRMIEYQEKHGGKVPDLSSDCEIERAVRGLGV